MIKSKIEAREKAMELAMPLAIALLGGDKPVNFVALADEIKDYIIGDTELPETEPSAEELTMRAIQQVVEATKSSYPNPAWAVNATMPEPGTEY